MYWLRCATVVAHVGLCRSFSLDTTLKFIAFCQPRLLRLHPLSPNTPVLTRTWTNVHTVLVELLVHCLSAPVFPTLLRLVDQFVRESPDDILLDKRLRKELQDVTQRAAEVCASIAVKAMDLPPSLAAPTSTMTVPGAAATAAAATAATPASTPRGHTAITAEMQQAMDMHRAKVRVAPCAAPRWRNLARSAERRL